MNLRSTQMADEMPEPLTQRESEVLGLLADLTLSNQEIAGRLFLTLTTVKWHIQQIYTKMGVNNRRQAIARAAELGLLSPASNELPRLHNFPVQLSSFIGREQEVATIGRILSSPTFRLVTLTGAGGVGKTRLALKVAEQVQRNYQHGVWLVELAPLSDPTLVTQSVAGVFKLSEISDPSWSVVLQGYLCSRELLLVLDNCEHLIEACAALVEALLKTCPHLNILATSREALRIEGEMPYIVPSMPFPDPQDLPGLVQATQFEAVRLFVERARLVEPGFELAQSNVRAVSLICQRLDGIPLALELAAARLRLLNVEELAEHLSDAFEFLTGGSRATLARHQTLRGVIDWSYDLLSAQERILLWRLAVFSGGCTLEAVVAVCADEIGSAMEAEQHSDSSKAAGLHPSTILKLLAGLVDKSMVLAKIQAEEPTRYHLLEMIRQYGHDKLLLAGEAETLRRRHRDFFLHFVESNRHKLYSPQWMIWIQKFNADYENIRLALEWSYSHNSVNVDAGPRLTWAMRPFWIARQVNEPGKWADKGVALCQSGAGLPPVHLARMLSFWPWTRTAGLAQMVAKADESLAISRSLGLADKETLLVSLATRADLGLSIPEDWDNVQALIEERAAVIQSLGPESQVDPRFYLSRNKLFQANLEIRQGQFEMARNHIQECIQLNKACGHEYWLIDPYRLMGTIELLTGDFPQARQHLTASLTLATMYENISQGDSLALLCEVELRAGNLEQAIAYCKDFIRLAYEKQTPFSVLERLEMLARILVRQERLIQAARLSGVAEALSEKNGRGISSETVEYIFPEWRTRSPDMALDRLIPDWRTRPDGEQISQAWVAGRAMTYEQAVEYAWQM